MLGAAALTATQAVAQPDLLYGDIHDVMNNTSTVNVNGFRAYTLGVPKNPGGG